MKDQARVVGCVSSGGFENSAGKPMAHGYVQKYIANDDGSWSTELPGRKLATKRKKIPLVDVNASHIRS